MLEDTATATPPTASGSEVALKHQALAARTGLIAGDTLARIIGEYDDEERDLILWFYHYLRDNALGYDEGALLIKKPDGSTYSRDSVYQLLTGRRDENTRRPILRAIAAFKEIREAELASRRAPFIETSLSQRIFSYLDACQVNHRLGFIWGDSQIGKTEALEEYQRRNNHGRTIYVRVGARGMYTDFIQRLCQKCGISASLASHKAKVRILDYFKANMLLIVDELHNAFTPTERPTSYDILEFCREIFDMTKCGVVFCATDVLRETLERSGAYRKIAMQSRKRALGALRLEPVPLQADLALFSAHYGLPAATGEALDLQREVIRQDGLGVWLTYLSTGRRFCDKSKTKRPMHWEDVIKAHAAIAKLSQPPTDGGAL